MTSPLISLRNAGFGYAYRQGLTVRKFKALKSIDLDIMPGETLGVVGFNGSGKSTLLKVLARIYQPDSGSIVFNSKKISLLSLSLGFDAQLSGIDNALLSSMLLGATYKEAKQILPEILEFSELGPAAHQPVKTFSSGMRSRLGFSVALQMRADVMLIDEALAVGDAKFSRKSEKALAERITSSQTVVLVSHSPAQIVKLCDRVVWVDQGQIKSCGEPKEVIKAYREASTQETLSP